MWTLDAWRWLVAALSLIALIVLARVALRDFLRALSAEAFVFATRLSRLTSALPGRIRAGTAVGDTWNTMRQRPSLFNYATADVASNRELWCHRIDVTKDVITFANPFFTIMPPLPVIGSNTKWNQRWAS